jgi:hypothetical protein
MHNQVPQQHHSTNISYDLGLSLVERKIFRKMQAEKEIKLEA